MKKITSLILALVMCLSLCATAFAAYGETGDETTDTDVTWNFTGADEDLNQLNEILPLVTSFSDVGRTAWFYNDVMECAKLGIVQGFEDGKFHPEDKVTSIQFLVMLTRTFYNDTVESYKKLAVNGQAWYWPNTQAAKQIGISTGLAKIDEDPMNRYEMAVALHNILAKKGYTPTNVEIARIGMLMPDTATATTAYKTAVANCYNNKIITGMDNGNFEGAQSMTRAQACTVIVRMLKLVNKYNPGDNDNDQYDDGKSQVEETVGKLANGQPATVENVVAILKQIEREYPTNTPWGPDGTANNNWYKETAGSDVTTLNKQLKNRLGSYGTNLQYSCGGFMAMVSDRIFGKSGAPAREIYSFAEARPGDIVYQIKTATGEISHVATITDVQTVNGKAMASTCDGNVNGHINWTWNGAAGIGAYGMTNKPGNLQYRIFTRYPA